MTYFETYLFSIGFPIMLFFALFIYYRVTVVRVLRKTMIRAEQDAKARALMRKRWEERRNFMLKNNMIVSDKDRPETFTDMMQSINEHVRYSRKVRWSFVRFALYFAIFVYMPLAIKTFRWFLCLEVDEVLYLVADSRIVCYSGRWWLGATFALVIIVVYVVCLPCVILYRLLTVRKVLHLSGTQEAYGFLFLAYKRKAFLWEVQMLLRKVLLAGAPVFLYSYPVMQSTVSGVLSVAFHLMHSLYAPWKNAWGNALQHVALGATTLTFVMLPLQLHMTIINSGTPEASEKRAQISIFLVAFNYLVLVLAFVAIFATTKMSLGKARAMRKKLQEERSKKSENRLGKWLKRNSKLVRVMPDMIADEKREKLRLQQLKAAKKKEHEERAEIMKSIKKREAMLRGGREDARRRLLRRLGERSEAMSEHRHITSKLLKDRLLQDALHLPDEAAKLLISAMERKKYAANEVIHWKGAPCDHLLLLVSGSAREMLPNEAAVQEPAIFGTDRLVGVESRTRNGAVISASGAAVPPVGSSVTSSRKALQLMKSNDSLSFKGPCRYSHLAFAEGDTTFFRLPVRTLLSLQKRGFLQNRVAQMLNRMMRERNNKRSMLRAQTLRKIPLFHKLEPQHLNALAEDMHSKNCKKGALLIVEGQPSLTLFVVLSGTIQVTQGSGDDSVTVATIKTHQSFGEGALMPVPTAATATCRAGSDIVELLCLSRHSYLQMMLDGKLPQTLLREADSLYKLYKARRQDRMAKQQRASTERRHSIFGRSSR